MEERLADRMESRVRGNGLRADLNQRFSTAIMNFNAELSGCRTGALVQVWMPDLLADGSVVLQTRGLAFSISGVGDLLALFRCVSCRYQFAADTSKPHLMGVIGRVYSSAQPELCYDVQQYDRAVYLRASEAQWCGVHSTLVTPVYLSASRERPAAVVEVSHHDKDVKFPEIVNRLSSCLESVKLYTTDINFSHVRIGLRSWPVDFTSLEEGVLKNESGVVYNREGEHGLADVKHVLWTDRGNKKDCDESNDPLVGQLQGCCATLGPQLGDHTRVSRVSSLPPLRIPSRKEYVCKSASGPLSRPNFLGQHGYVCRSSSGPLSRPRPLLTSGCATPSSLPPAWAMGLGSPTGLEYAVTQTDHSMQQPALPGTATSGVQDIMGPDVQASSELAAVTTPAALASPLPSLDVPAQPDFLSSASDLSDIPDPKEQDSTLPSKDKQNEDDGSDGKGGKSSAEGTPSSGPNAKNDNRLGGGAGKRLTFKELQACFGVGLKEAAAQLGICPTTLKRACRRNGVSRWPSRQISKLSKAWRQMGYQGSPPEWLVQKAITGNLKCDNLAFSLNAGLHLGLMQTNSTQPLSSPHRPTGWNAVNMQCRTVPVPTAAGVKLDGGNRKIASVRPQAVPLSSSPPDQPDIYDEMASILQEPSAPLGWTCPQSSATALHALNAAHEAPRVFRSSSQYGAQGFQCGSSDLSARVEMDVRQGQGRDQVVPMLSVFDGLGDAFTPDSGLANALNRSSMDNVIFSGMDVTPTGAEMGIAGELF